MNRWIERALETPAIYKLWQAPFVAQKFEPAERHLRARSIRRVLDVGCGPGTNAPRFTGTDYVGIDINERYLVVARARYPGRFVQVDLATADIMSLGRFDTILVNSVLHHLPDTVVSTMLHQMTQLLDADGAVHVLELVTPDRLSWATMMAKLDRGRYARTLTQWRHLLTSHFDPVVFEPYRYGFGLWAMLYFQGRARICASR